MSVESVELLAPAGNFETALAAFEAGADAVYCGLTDFSARAFADNFTLDDLKNLLRYARGARSSSDSSHSRDARIARRKVYVTFNTIVDEDNIDAAIEQLAQLDEVRPDALIVQDLGVARICRKHFPGLELHASTQLVAHNLEGVLALKELGFKRVVLARELSLEEIASIAKRCGGMELEVFIHGALCYSISGLCLFGAMEKGRSGNRGKCPYCCREGRSKSEKGKSVDVVYPFSMKDLRLGEDVRNLADAGVASLKIEGRMKSALYVASVTRYYRQILESTRVGLESDRVGLGSDRVGLESDRVGLGSDRVGLGSDRVGLGSDRVGLGSDRVGVSPRAKVTVADLETVFSRRTTKLYFDGRPSDNRAVKHSNIRTLEHLNNPNNQTLEHSNNSNTRTIPQPNNSPVDSESLGHLGAEIGVVKRITKDREGLRWLRFHTARGLEKHDGLQFEAMVDGKHVGMGVVEMRQAISRRAVFEVNAGVDVEVLLPGMEGRAPARPDATDLAQVLKPGMKIYCSMSNAVKRMFPTPSFRPSDYEGGIELDIDVSLSPSRLTSKVLRPFALEVSAPCTLQPAKSPEKTYEGVKRAFSKLGETDYRLGKLTLNDPEKLFAPMSVLNDLRRDLVERLDAARDVARREKVEVAIGEAVSSPLHGEEEAFACRSGEDAASPKKRVKVRFGQTIPPGDWDEVIVAIGSDRVGLESDRVRLESDRVGLESDRVRLESDRVGLGAEKVGERSGTLRVPLLTLNDPQPTLTDSMSTLTDSMSTLTDSMSTLNDPQSTLNDPQSTLTDSMSTLSDPRVAIRLALPVYTAEPDFNKLRTTVKRYIREGFKKWEASDLATLRMLKALGITDITADWTLYAFNSRALAELSEQGVKRFVASPENNRENLQYLAESGYDVEFLSQQSTPLFVSLTAPAAQPDDLAVFRRDGLWVTTKPVPRTFETPRGVSIRLDLSWDPS